MADRLMASGVTRKEAEVLAGLGEQLTNAEIAARLYVSERTVETHVSSLLRKLHASNRRELGRLAVRLASPPAPAEVTVGPSGTVTFLFTDIEDSTVLWERLPRLMPAALARHDAVLREAITSHDGRIFSTAGDSFGAAFASAAAAVAAAVDAQRTLAAEPCPRDVPVRVRMGLHTGTATERDGTYFGAVVNRAARIAAGGHGGQILLSVATADLVAGEGWTTVDLGWHRLRGIERPERIVRLDAPALPIVDLPLRATRERAGNLPRAPASLIGRSDELSRLVVALGTNTLVTITGPGGSGKTRLAIAAAHAVADDFPDGAWLVELGELQSAADVAAAVSTALGLLSASGADGAASTVAAMADHRALLVLDNCEHVIDGVVEFVTELESRGGRITVLATSREALGLGHERRFALRPLGVDQGGGRSDATELFCERATGVLGSFEPSDADLAIIDEICRRLDGLPLAIELATARLSAMTLAELRARLDDSFDVLSARRGLKPRQQSLRATVAWSYDLLTPAEQGFFDQLSVFGSDFGPGAAHAVAGDTPVPIDDLLRSLVDKSLLTATHGPLGTRFRQLETLRQYAEARLDAGGGVPASMRRQLDYYLTWTESADAGVRGADEVHWHHGFTTEWPNIRNAVRWACRVDDGDAACRLVSATLWWATSRMRLEAELWCELALSLPSASDNPLRPVLLSGAALFAHMRGDDDGDRRALELARAEEERLGPASEPWVQVAVLNQWNGGPAAALRDASALQSRADAADDDFWRLRAALGEALILATLIGDAPPPPDPAFVARIRAVVDQADAFGHPSSVASASVSLGMALRASEPSEALALLEKGLDLCAPLGVEDTSSTARHELASHYTQLGRPLDALVILGDALPRYLRVGTWHEVWPALAHIAFVLAVAGHPRVAATVVGCIAANRSDAYLEHHQLRTLENELRLELGDAEFEGLLGTARSLPVGAVAQLVSETIDEIIG